MSATAQESQRGKPKHATAVLMVLRLAPPDYSGAGLQALRLARALRAQGEEVVMFSGSSRSTHPRWERVDGVPIFRWPVFGPPRLRKLGMSIGLAFHLLKNRRRYRVAHLHGTAYLLVTLRALKRILRFAVVYKPTSIGRDDAPKVGDKYGRWTLGAVDRWICIADAIATSALETGVSQGRIARMSNGVDMRRFRPLEGTARAAVRRDLAVGDDVQLWITVGPIVPGKRFDLLIEAWALLPGGRDLIVVGPTEYESDMGVVRDSDNSLRLALDGLVAARGLGGRVRFLGARADVERLLGAADAFVFASEREGMPNAVLEALSVGLPVVSTRIGAAENLSRVADGRITFSEATPEALAGAVLSLSTGPGRVPDSLVKEHDLATLAGRYGTLYAQLRSERLGRDRTWG